MSASGLERILHALAANIKSPGVEKHEGCGEIDVGSCIPEGGGRRT